MTAIFDQSPVIHFASKRAELDFPAPEGPDIPRRILDFLRSAFLRIGAMGMVENGKYVKTRHYDAFGFLAWFGSP